MSKKLEDFTNSELKQYCTDDGIKVESKNVSKPTKKEYLTAIKLAANSSQELEPEVITETDELEDEMTDADDFLNIGEPVATKVISSKKKKLTRAQKRKIQYSELMPLRRVLITSNATNQTQQNLHFVTWGNGLIGHNTDRVYLGKPWHVREGALRNMEQAIITTPVQDDEGNQVRFETKPAFNIRRLDPLSKTEIELIGKRQTIRDSSIESLI